MLIGGLGLPGWAIGLVVGVSACVVLSLPISVLLARLIALGIEPHEEEARHPAAASASTAETGRPETELAAPADAAASTAAKDAPRRILVVDDDAALRLLLRTTLAADEFEVEDAASVDQAAAVARFWRPTFVILDVGLPGTDGLTLCRDLKRARDNNGPIVILLTGADTSEDEARAAGADALLRKPFSPLELVNLLDKLESRASEFVVQPQEAGEEQLLLYARDLSRMLEIERAQRRLLQQAYRQTTTALADALEAKDRRTGLHALRVQRYALELTSAYDRSLLDDPSLEYGFLLHDIGKIAIPEPILNKPGPLTADERLVIQQHPVIGVEILHDVPLLYGEGIRIVRSHHERWDGTGYPDRLAEEEIPIGARIFALADTLDAMTTDRPYREARSWEDAVDEILAEGARQFDPRVVSAFALREQRLRRLHSELTAVAA